ncbi:dethiobiotin synthase [Thermodesulfobacteriota bacterium]
MSTGKGNRINFPEKIFITGTDTGIGKTLISAVLLAGFKGKYWKPVQSGIEDITDTQWIMEKTGLDESHFLEETFRLRLPLSPHAAAEADGVYIDLNKFQTPDINKGETLIIEGAGGIMVPLNNKTLMTDLIRKCDTPVILVAGSQLGTINHTLLSVAYLKSIGVNIFGVVMNGQKNSINRDAIEHFGKVEVIAEIENLEAINPETLKNCFRKNFT